MFTIACVVLLFYLFYKWSTANDDYFAKKGVAFVKPTFLFGTAVNLFLRKISAPDRFIQSHLDMKHEKFVSVFFFSIIEFKTNFHLKESLASSHSAHRFSLSMTQNF
jgi:hypothetical protein